ncbi:hypothetical protein F4781DRAFT_385307 [Annulohypoxylon bovei var. microspora]|nr:hypothetical protein F4781DRAFT_385307 [Annulohypoxylon bovei var. microspora]
MIYANISHALKRPRDPWMSQLAGSIIAATNTKITGMSRYGNSRLLTALNLLTAILDEFTISILLCYYDVRNSRCQKIITMDYDGSQAVVLRLTMTMLCGLPRLTVYGTRRPRPRDHD